MIEIRRCREEDFERIVLLLKQLWPGSAIEPKGLRSVFQRGLTSEAQCYMCAVEEGRIVGFCSLTLKNNLWQQGYLAHIDELVVDESARGQGTGTRLLMAAKEMARQNNCKRVELDSAFHRVEAHKFYERLGFQSRAMLFSADLTEEGA